MIGKEKKLNRHPKSARGQPVTERSRAGHVDQASCEISTEAEAEARTTPRRVHAAFDAPSYHPLSGPRETD